MLVGAAGLVMAWQGIAVSDVAIPLMLLALFAMGVHSTFFGPIKYAILPQHLKTDEVLGGTGLVEAGTYIAILGGTILAGMHPGRVRPRSRVVVIALRRLYRRPPGAARAAARATAEPIDCHIIRSSIALVARHHAHRRGCSSRSSRSASSGRSARCCSSSSRRWSRTC